MNAPTSGIALTTLHEGTCFVPYYDQFGFPTNGRGHKLSSQAKEPLSNFPVASPAQVEAWFAADYATAVQECQQVFGPAWDTFNSARQAAFIDMAFEMGEHGLANFHGMIAATKINDWAKAGVEAEDSLWDRQVPHRASHDVALIQTGDWNSLIALLA